MSPSGAAFAAGALTALAVADLVAGATAAAAERAPALTGPLRAAADVVTRAASEGRDPVAAERRRLLLLAAAISCLVAAALLGPVAGVIAAAVTPAAGARVLRARAARYRRSVDDAAADIAIAIADALSGGHSLRGAILSAARSLQGPAGHALREVAVQLELGAATDDALERMRARIGSGRLDVVVAGALLQRRAGGDLAKLLREAARSFEDEARLLGEVRAATAQARFTGLVVVLLPLGGAGLAELGSPGFLSGLIASPLSAWFLGLAVAMQVGAAFAIRRLARVRA